MKPNELRIGNYVIDNEDGNLYQIPTGISINNSHFMSPIQITEEWLINFGFKYDKETKTYHTPSFYWFSVNLYAKEGAGFCIENVQYKFINHVHELQNLYFALTGTELTLNK